MAKVDPFVINIPKKLREDVETSAYFTYLNKFLHDLWTRTGQGDDKINGGDAPIVSYHSMTIESDQEEAPVCSMSQPAIDDAPNTSYQVENKSDTDGPWLYLLGLITDITTKIRNTLIPTGLIAIWSGSTASIPTGWQICDGTNSTPDLRDKFIVGAGTSYSVDGTGGSVDYALSVTSTATGLTTGTPSATQDVQSGATATVASSGHTHSVANHTHDVTDTIDVLPPYHALAFIMKL